MELYRDNNRSNTVQAEIGEGQNTFLEFYMKEITGSPTWNSFQIGMNVSFQNKYVNLIGATHNYLKETNSEGWTRVEIPLADFAHDPAEWTSGGVSNIGFKTVAGFGSGNFVFGVDEVTFTGGPSPFVWYGDDYLISGEEGSVYTLDVNEFYIIDRPLAGGAVPFSGFSGMSTMSAPIEAEDAPVENSTTAPTQDYRVTVHDGNGHYLDRFNINVKQSEISNVDFRSYVRQQGTYIFRIMSNEGKLISERILFNQ